jgi:hypothetical protein
MRLSGMTKDEFRKWLESFKRWFKPFAIFCASVVISTYLYLTTTIALWSAVNSDIANYFPNDPFSSFINFYFIGRVSGYAVVCFVIFWSWFHLRAKRPLDSLRWFGPLIAGAVITQTFAVLFFTFSIPNIVLAGPNLVPEYIPMSLALLFAAVVVAEASFWVLKKQTSPSSGLVRGLTKLTD